MAAVWQKIHMASYVTLWIGQQCANCTFFLQRNNNNKGIVNKKVCRLILIFLVPPFQVPCLLSVDLQFWVGYTLLEFLHFYMSPNFEPAKLQLSAINRICDWVMSAIGFLWWIDCELDSLLPSARQSMAGVHKYWSRFRKLPKVSIEDLLNIKSQLKTWQI